MILWAIFLTLVAAIAVVVLVVGVFLLAAVLQTGWRATERTQATVVGHEISEDDEGTYYRPVARFTAAGQEFVVRGQLAASSRPPCRMGQTITVYFPRGQPDQALLHRFEGWWIALLPVVLGAGFLLGVVNEVARLLR